MVLPFLRLPSSNWVMPRGSTFTSRTGGRAMKP
jgi:hypothetical protein